MIKNNRLSNMRKRMNKGQRTSIKSLRHQINNNTGRIRMGNPQKEYGALNRTFELVVARRIGNVSVMVYNKQNVYNSILQQTGTRIWNPGLLMKILTVAESWIGAHVESLEHYIINTRQGHDENNVPFDWPMCSGSCTSAGLGSCDGWCIGGSCKEIMRPNPGDGSGDDTYPDIGTGHKEYTVQFTYNL